MLDTDFDMPNKHLNASAIVNQQFIVSEKLDGVSLIDKRPSTN